MRAFIIVMCVHTAWTYFNASNLVGWHLKHGVRIASKIKKAEDSLFNDRIVGGDPTARVNVPYLVGLLIDVGSPWPSACGASLISATRVLTAGHCWYDGESLARRITAVIGSQYLFYGGLRIHVTQTIIHPQFDLSTYSNDVAVLYLPATLSFSDTIQPIRLPSGSILNENIDGAWVKASGYGKYSDHTNPTVNTMHRYVMIQVMPNKQCRQIYGNVVRYENICTVGYGGVGICLGDSGGPLTINKHGQEVLIGISAFVADAGCEKNYPSVFTRVSSYIDWIRAELDKK